MNKQILNVGIFAHADAGKTSITENILLIAGKTKKLGSVDDGTTNTDYLEVEKIRGISVRSSYTSFEYNNKLINLIDTPGHVDFTSDIERSILIIDIAILVISAAEGIQAQTEIIWEGLKERNIPVIFFINKIDRTEADTQFVIENIEKELTKSIALLNKVTNEATNEVEIKSIWDCKTLNNKTIENLANCNDDILNSFIEEKEIKFDFANKCLKAAINKKCIYPIIFGSAKKSIGINELLDTISAYIKTNDKNSEENLSAFVFAITHDKQKNKVTHVKLFQGKISNREIIYNHTQKIEEKVTQVRKTFANSFEDIGIVNTGDVAGILGLKNSQIGDILGSSSKEIPNSINLKTPLLTVQIKPENNKDFANLAYALQELNSEDPNLNFKWLKDENELHIKVMGWIQMQILESIIEDRFNIKAKLENPTIIYKETPSKKGYGFVKYWMPKPCWAIMKFKIEPAEKGSGITYSSEISVDDVHQKYQNEVERTIPKALEQGIKGWEVTDIKITLVEGEDHQVHSNPGDFVVATPIGIMNGLKEIGTTLLEPIISFKISAPENLLGIITSDITKMRGTFNSPSIENGKFKLTGTLPLATSLDYPVKLSSRSGGKAKISTKFHSYEKCTDEQGVIREFKGISPLDTAKYILKARKAIQ